MLCLELWINGERKCRAGAHGADFLQASVQLLPLDKEAGVEIVGNLPAEGRFEDFLAWETFGLSVGDEIVLRMVEADDADPATVAQHGAGVVEEPRSGPICLLCGKSFTETESVIRGKKGFLCAECIRSASESLSLPNQ